MGEQPYFFINAPGITGQTAICSHDTVARHNDGEFIVSYRAAYGLR